MTELTAIIVVNGERIPAKEYLKSINATTNADANQTDVGGDELSYRFPLTNEIETESEFEKRKNSYWSLIRAHWKDNSLRFAWQRLTDVFDKEDPDFKITEQDVEGYEEFPVLMKSKNRAEFDAMRKIADDIKLQRRIMAEHGMAANITASLVAGLGDPIAWSTGMAGAKVVNSGFKILGVAKKMSAAKTAVAKAVTTGSTAAALDTTVRHAFVGDVASMQEYTIGATTSGIIGGFVSAAPNIWRSMSGRHRNECIKCCAELAKDLQTPVPIESGYYQIEGAFGLSSLTLGSPDVTLANSPFKTGKDFGAKAFTFSFHVTNEKGERIAKGPAVEMLIHNAKAIYNNEARKGTYAIFNEWLKESGYDWLERKFIGWKSSDIKHGKAFIDFSNECRHARCYPNEPCKASVRKMLAFEEAFQGKIIQKAWDAGVFNKNIEAFKATLKKELKDLKKRLDNYTSDVAQNERLMLAERTTESELQGKLTELHQNLESFDADVSLLKQQKKQNAAALAFLKNAARKEKAGLERADKQANILEGEKRAGEKISKKVEKVYDPLSAKKQGMEIVKNSLKESIKKGKEEIRRLRHIRPELREAKAKYKNELLGQREKTEKLIENSQNEIDALFKKQDPNVSFTLTEEAVPVIEQSVSEFGADFIKPKLDGIITRCRNILRKTQEGTFVRRRTKSGKLAKVKKDQAVDEAISLEALEGISKEIASLKEEIKYTIYNEKVAKETIPPQITEILSEIEREFGLLDELTVHLKRVSLAENRVKGIYANVNKAIERASIKQKKVAERYKQWEERHSKTASDIEALEEIQSSLTDMHEAVLEQQRIVKKEIGSFKKLLTENRRMQKVIAKKREKIETKRLSNEEIEKIKYIKGRLERNDFTIKDISNIKDEFWFHRIYDRNALGSDKGNARNRLIHSLMRGYREGGSTLTDEELRLSAIRTSEKILGEAEAQHHNVRKQRGLELKRAVDIPSHYIEEFLVGDPLMLMYSTVDTLCPDIELMKAFGTLNKNDILKNLEFEKKQMQLHAKSNKEFNSIDETYQKTYNAISLSWDRLRGDVRADAQMGARLLRAWRNWNVATKLGKLPITTLYNLALIQQHHGLTRYITTAFRTKSPKGFFGNALNANAWIRMFEATGQSRLLELSASLSNTFDDVLARAAVHLTFAQKIDDHIKAGVGYCVLEKIIHACRKTASGGRLKKSLSDELRRLGISKEYELKIAKEFGLHGSIGEKGVVAAGVENWSEDVADVFTSAIRQAQFEITLAPTAGATPALFDNAWLATLLQFKRCLATAYSKATLPLVQDANRGKFIKVGSVIATSAAIAYLKELAMDLVTPRKRTFEDRLLKALGSMDVLTWGGYMIDVANSLRQQGKGLNTFETERAMSDIFGVGYGTAKDAINSFKAIQGVGTGEKMTRVQANAIRRMVPLNNMIWWSWMIDSMIDERFPLKQKKQKEFKEGIITFPDTF